MRNMVTSENEYVNCEKSKSCHILAAKKRKNHDKKSVSEYQSGTADGISCEIEEDSQWISMWLNLMKKEGDMSGTQTESEENISGQTVEQGAEETEEDDISKQVASMKEMLDSMKKAAERYKSSRINKSLKKALNYHYKRVSSLILRAKTISQAGNALTSARSELAQLQRKLYSSSYDSSEVQLAVTHAKKMVITARKKVQHMRQEVHHDRADKNIEIGRKQSTGKVNKQKKAVSSVEMMQQEKELMLLKKEQKAIRERNKNKHRQEENLALMRADLEYIKKKNEMLRQESLQTVSVQVDIPQTVNIQIEGLQTENEQVPAETQTGTTETAVAASGSFNETV